MEAQRDADAVRLFLERAERAGAVIDDIESVAALCRRLDGIPLALELAAARLRAFSAEQMLDQLDEGWSVSARSRDDRLTHHTSLDDAIDWSFRLLDDGERELLLVLSAFRGPFDLAAAARIADHDLLTTADRLAQLVEKSLVQSAPGRAGRRFRLLETVRAFAAIRVDPAIEAAMRDRHARYFADQVTTLGALVPGPEEDDASARLAVELDDVHAAFEHAAASGDVAMAAELASGPRLSLSTESARWAQLARRAVELPGIEDQPAYVALLASAAWGAVLTADLPLARELALRGLHVEGDLAQHPRLCWILPQATGGSFVEGADCCMVGAEVAARRDDGEAESFLLATAAIYRVAAGDEAAAIDAARRALALARAIGSRSLRARAAGALCYAAQDIDAAMARGAAQEVLEIADAGDFHLNMPHRVLAILAWRDGDFAAAADHAAAAAFLIRDQGDRYVQAASMRQLATLVGTVDAPLAAELLGIADSLVPEVRVIARDEIAGARLRADLDAVLDPEELAGLVERGRRSDSRMAYATVERALRRVRRGR